MQDLTLEKELRIRINQHKITMLMADIAKQYKDGQKADKGTTLSEPIIEQQAVNVAQQMTNQIMLNGNLDREYMKAWENLKEVIPDNYCTLQ